MTGSKTMDRRVMFQTPFGGIYLVSRREPVGGLMSMRCYAFAFSLSSFDCRECFCDMIKHLR
jgi:hypothetical protein